MPEFAPTLEPIRPTNPMPRDLAAAIVDVAKSERALDDVIGYAQRLHRSNIQHDPHTCLVCFGAA
jgi:hypothetical protein